MRHLLSLLILSAALPGCIIYATDGHRSRGEWTHEDGEGTEPRDDERDDPVDEPRLADDLFLSIAEGAAGDSLLSTLESTADRDFRQLRSVDFERDVAVTDQILRRDEAVLLLRVADSAAPGEVAVTVTTSGGETLQLPRSFSIQAAGTTPGDTGTSDTGTGTGDTGSGATGTGDTGSGTSADPATP